MADAWNSRIQRLDRDGRPLAQYPIPGWEGQSITNKPYLAVTLEHHILVTVPDVGTVLELVPDGAQIGAVQPEGAGGAGASQPTGLATGSAGQTYVVDNRGGVVYRLPPPR